MQDHLKDGAFYLSYFNIFIDLLEAKVSRVPVSFPLRFFGEIVLLLNEEFFNTA